MRSVDILVEEHRWIRSLLDSLSRFVAIHAADGGLDAQAGQELLDLFEAFADGSHQEKEERCLFPRLRTLASGKEARLLKRLAEEHTEDRVSFATLRAQLQLALAGDETAKRGFASDADAYLRMQHRHMKAENTVVFAMAERILTSQDDQKLIEEFDRLDHTGPEGTRRLTQRIEALGKKLGVPR